MLFGIIFDLDGTMVDNKNYHMNAWIEVCGKYGVTVTCDDYYKNIHARTNTTIMKNVFGETFDSKQATAVATEKEQTYRRLYKHNVREITGLKCLLEQFRSKCVPMGVASNSPVDNVSLVLDELGIRNYFSAVTTADDVINGKPDPEIFIKTAAKIGVPVTQCLIFEDSPTGFQAARNARAPYIAITAGNHDLPAGEAADAASIFHDYTALSVEIVKKFVM